MGGCVVLFSDIAQYFLHIDIIVNAICVVATFKWQYPICSRQQRVVNTERSAAGSSHVSHDINDLLDMMDDEGNLTMCRIRKDNQRKLNQEVNPSQTAVTEIAGC